MPAVTFRHSTIHSSQNCGVANRAVRGHVAPSSPCARATAPASSPPAANPARGTRTVNTPNIMNAK